MTTKLAFNQIGNSSVNLGDSATGDGVTDETSLVQAALDSGAKEVVVPHGKTFLCTSTLTRPADVVIKGSGTIKFNLTVVGDYGLHVTTDGGGIGEVKFENVSAVGNTETVRLEDVNNVFVKGIEIDGGHYGLSVQNVAAVYTVNQDLEISGNYVHDTDSSGYDIGKVSNSLIYANRAESCGTDGFKFREECKEINIIGNNARLCTRDGFDFFDGVRNSTIAMNVADGNTLQGFECKGTLSGTDYVFRDNTITGNVAKGNGTSGFLIQSVRDCTFNGNMSQGNTTMGYFLNAVQGCSFTGDQAVKNLQNGFHGLDGSRNIFTGCIAMDNSYVDGTTQNGTYHGFNLEAAFDSCDLTGCRALNGTTASHRGGQGYGINFVSGSAGNRVIGGRFDDNVTGDFGGDPASNNIAVFDSGNDFDIQPAGSVSFGTHTAIGAETVTGYITIKDEGGTSRKIAVVS